MWEDLGVNVLKLHEVTRSITTSLDNNSVVDFIFTDISPWLQYFVASHLRCPHRRQ